MKGFIRKMVVLLGSAGALAGAVGCNHPDLYDPCYPERYWHSSRQNVNAAFAQQVRNGHVLDQTVWNFHFCPGTDLLTPGGMEHLAYIARRRPEADPCVYLETAKDLCFDQSCPEQFVKARAALDQCRIAA